MGRRRALPKDGAFEGGRLDAAQSAVCDASSRRQFPPNGPSICPRPPKLPADDPLMAIRVIESAAPGTAQSFQDNAQLAQANVVQQLEHDGFWPSFSSAESYLPKVGEEERQSAGPLARARAACLPPGVRSAAQLTPRQVGCAAQQLAELGEDQLGCMEERMPIPFSLASSHSRSSARPSTFASRRAVPRHRRPRCRGRGVRVRKHLDGRPSARHDVRHPQRQGQGERLAAARDSSVFTLLRGGEAAAPIGRRVVSQRPELLLLLLLLLLLCCCSSSSSSSTHTHTTTTTTTTRSHELGLKSKEQQQSSSSHGPFASSQLSPRSRVRRVGRQSSSARTGSRCMHAMTYVLYCTSAVLQRSTPSLCAAPQRKFVRPYACPVCSTPFGQVLTLVACVLGAASGAPHAPAERAHSAPPPRAPSRALVRPRAPATSSHLAARRFARRCHCCRLCLRGWVWGSAHAPQARAAAVWRALWGGVRPPPTPRAWGWV